VCGQRIGVLFHRELMMRHLVPAVPNHKWSGHPVRVSIVKRPSVIVIDLIDAGGVFADQPRLTTD